MLPNKVKIVEVGPRDGLQNENQVVPTATASPSNSTTAA